jgi:NADH:ubiquinone oxidoreductase subunit 5 (subunit L)/multisubunit Na+/H+ antiporter MnhA subunit
MLYRKRPAVDPIEKTLNGLYVILKNKYYFDSVYNWYVECVQQKSALLLSQFEKIYIDRLCVGGLKNTAKTSARVFRHLQNGLVGFYALIFVLGAILLFLFLMQLNRYPI